MFVIAVKLLIALIAKLSANPKVATKTASIFLTQSCGTSIAGQKKTVLNYPSNAP